MHLFLLLSLPIPGQLIQTLVNEEKEPGEYTFIWDGSERLPSGIYFLRFKAKGYERTRRVVLVK